MRKVPIMATIVVIAAVLTMIALGVWQLGRLEEKEAMIARFEAAAGNSSMLSSWPVNEASQNLYRRAPFSCDEVVGWSAIAGRNAEDQSGYVHIAQCNSDEIFSFDGPGYVVEAVIGWSRRPQNPDWQGGEIVGTIAPGGDMGYRIVADPPLAGLEANATPDPNDTPNNHLAYAGQWFLFAFSALLIYWLALRRRWRDGD